MYSRRYHISVELKKHEDESQVMDFGGKKMKSV